MEVSKEQLDFTLERLEAQYRARKTEPVRLIQEIRERFKVGLAEAKYILDVALLAWLPDQVRRPS